MISQRRPRLRRRDRHRHDRLSAPDAIAGLLIWLQILPRAAKLLRETTSVLLESTHPGPSPRRRPPHLLELELEHEHVRVVHDIHASLIAGGLPVLSAGGRRLLPPAWTDDSFPHPHVFRVRPEEPHHQHRREGPLPPGTHPTRAGRVLEWWVTPVPCRPRAAGWLGRGSCGRGRRRCREWRKWRGRGSARTFR